MKILILGEHDNAKLSPTIKNLVTLGLEFGDDVSVLIAGDDCQNVCEQVGKIKGVKKVLYANNPAYKYNIAENISGLVVKLAHSYDVILAPASTFGKNILPKVAASLDVPQVSDVIKMIDTHTFEHPIYAGNAIETIEVNAEKILLTVRSTAFEPQNLEQDSALIENIDIVCSDNRIEFIKHEKSESARPDLTSASIVVSGGRGLQDKEKFKLIDDLADVLGAAIGASRAAVDAGFVPNDYQVGQTGKVVAPLLYFAIGISGAIQHMAGMKDSKIIVAINKDPDASIFSIANYAMVGDLFTILPELTSKLKERLSR